MIVRVEKLGWRLAKFLIPRVLSPLPIIFLK